MPPKQNATLAKTMGKNIKQYRKKMFPDHGGQGKCIAAFYSLDGIKPKDPKRVKWSRWERGVAIPEDAEQYRLADFFGVPLSELRGESNFNRNRHVNDVELIQRDGITYDEKGDMADTDIVEALKDHIATLKQQNEELRQEKNELKVEVAELREENKHLLTLCTVKDTRQAESG